MSYDVGDQVHLACTFYTTAGVPTNPTTATLTITKPDQSTTSPTLVAEGSGVYSYDYAPTAVGWHLVKFTGTGTVVTTEWSRFYVRDSAAELAGTYPNGKQSWEPLS